MFSGSDSSSLLARMRPLEDALARGAAPELQNIAFTAWLASRDRIADEPWRAAFVVANTTELGGMLAAARAKIESGAREWDDPRGAWVRSDPITVDGGVVALFPGQGSQYPDMLRDLATYFPVVRESFAEADRILAGELRGTLSSMIFPPPRFAPEEEKRAQQALTATDIAQPALGAAAIGAFRLLREFGVDVKQVAGHSYGEYPALWAAERDRHRNTPAPLPRSGHGDSGVGGGRPRNDALLRSYAGRGRRAHRRRF